jgi:hypothetical protein
MLADSHEFAYKLATKNVLGVFNVIYGWEFGWEGGSLYKVRPNNWSHMSLLQRTSCLGLALFVTRISVSAWIIQG